MFKGRGDTQIADGVMQERLKDGCLIVNFEFTEDEMKKNKEREERHKQQEEVEERKINYTENPDNDQGVPLSRGGIRGIRELRKSKVGEDILGPNRFEKFES